MPLGPPLRPGDTWFKHVVINDQGQIAGNLRDAKAHDHACLVKGEKLLRLPELGAGASEVSAINNQGVIVGTGAFHGRMRAFKLTPFDPHSPAVIRGARSEACPPSWGSAPRRPGRRKEIRSRMFRLAPAGY